METILKQILRFSAVGISSSLVNLGIYNGVLFILRSLNWFPGFDFLIGQFFGFVISVGWTFLLNRRYVFNAPKEKTVPWFRALLKVYITYAATGIGLSSLLSLFWVYVIHLPKEILTVLNDALCFPVAFLLNKYWVFRKS